MEYNFTSITNRAAMGSGKWLAMEERHQAGSVPEGIIPYTVADMEFQNPPQITKALQDWLATGILGYTRPSPRYYAAICNWMQQRHSIRLLPEELVITPGVVPALVLSVQSFTKQGEGVIVMPPVYTPFFAAAERIGRHCVHCPLKEENLDYSIDFALLEQLCQKPENTLLLFCNPHNPVGRVWRKQELERLGEICARNSVYVVSDEIHCDIMMPGHSHYSMRRVQSIARSLTVCTAPTKTFNLAAIQTANSIIPNPENRRKFKLAIENYHLESQNALGFVACTTAYEQCGPWLEALLPVLWGNYMYVRGFLQKHLPAVGLSTLMGTYLAWLDLRCLGLSEDALEQRLVAHHLFFVPGTHFGKEGAGFVRMNLACPLSGIQAAMDRLVRALNDFTVQKG